MFYLYKLKEEKPLRLSQAVMVTGIEKYEKKTGIAIIKILRLSQAVVFNKT